MVQNGVVQGFAKAIMPLFSIAVLLLFLDLGLRKKKAAYLVGLIFYGGLLGYLHDPSYIVSGYVDIAVSFFAFLSFYTLHRSRSENGTRPFSVTWLAVLFASTAAITKQAGLFILAVIPVWIFNKKFLRGPGAVFSKSAPGRRRQIIKPFLLLLTVGIVVVPWYLFKELQIRGGKDRSEIHMVQQAHQTAGYTERFVPGTRN
jgi:hypothetical protein